MLRRLIVLAAVTVVSLLLMFVNSKVLVGEQELQAQLQLVSKPDAPERVWKVTFNDLGGNGVLATTHEQQLIASRLAGTERIAKIPVKAISEVTPDHAIEITGGPEVNEDDLKRRLQGAPFKRPNEPKPFGHVNPGIDLRGGVEFVCQLRNELGGRVAADDEVMHVLRSRLDERGLTEPVVTKLSNGDVSVVIPGGSRADAARTRKVLEDTGALEFREILEEYDVALGQPGAKVEARPTGGWRFAPDTYHARGDIVAPKRVEPGFAPTKFYRLGKAELTGKDVADAKQELVQGEQAVAIAFTAAGATKNEQFTTRLFKTGPVHGTGSGTGRLAILFDGVVQSDPIVQSPSKANCQITGSFTQDEIDRLRTSLRAGSLAVVPEVISERVVGATLGHEAVSRAITTMLWSLVFIVTFLAFYYRRLGLVAIFSLVVCAALTWVTLSVFGATLTLPGIAGLVLSIAMSIDTNVLIYERIREELREDKGLVYAIERGYDRAFLTVIDSHLTTMSAGLVLYIIGTGPIKGFGLTLMIGIAISLFSGIYVGRLLTDWLCRGRETLSMSSLFKELPAPYVQWRFISYTLTVLTAALGIGWFALGHKVIGGGFDRNFDIDFTGGNMVQLIFKEPVGLNEVNAAIKAAEEKQAGGPRTLDDVRAQPYVAEFGVGGETTRQWMFRGRDEAGTVIEAERDAAEAKRSALQRRADVLRAENPPKDLEARALDKEVAQVAQQIREIQGRLAARTDAFKQAIATAFPGKVAAEGDEVLTATWQDKRLTLALVTLEAPTADQAARIAAELRKRDVLAAVEAKPLAPPALGLEVTATWREKPGPLAAATASANDPVFQRLASLIQAPTPEEVRGLAATAFELYNSVTALAGKQRLTVANPFPSSEHFSGQVAGQMKWRALAALAVAMVVMMLYIAARFEFAFGLGGMISLLHVVVQTVGIICLLGIRIDLTVIAALLTIIGYAINDTIVTFDRIRENLGKMAGRPLAEVINASIAQVMPRTVLTGGCTIVALGIMLLFAGDSLTAFTATLLIGTLLGTYSSVFVAAPLLIALQRKGSPLIPPPPPTPGVEVPPAGVSTGA